MYKVIQFFTDLHDKDHPYQVGDEFPRPGISVSEARCIELAGNNNKRGEPLIAWEEPVTEEAEKPKRTRKTPKN